MELLQKYAKLLCEYCLSLKEGDRLYVSSTFLAEPLLKEVYRHASSMGVLVEMNLGFSDMNKIFMGNATDSLLQTPSPFQSMAMKEFDAYMAIRAPYVLKDDIVPNKEKSAMRAKANEVINQLYFDRTAEGSLKRTLCQYPTQAAAEVANMTIEQYEDFIYSACKLYDEDPINSWKELGKNQQHIVDYLNTCDHITFRNDKTNISFSVKGRTWINSDGKANMPSGEVYTGPIENSVNGIVYFDYPSIYNNQEVSGITLLVVDGVVQKWSAEVGQEYLDNIMEIEGARMFGEVAVGTNYGIKVPTKNILFDEKIGGTIHMAIGQSYKQTGGVNQSSVHWDMITSMGNGVIIADGNEIYREGRFVL